MIGFGFIRTPESFKYSVDVLKGVDAPLLVARSDTGMALNKELSSLSVQPLSFAHVFELLALPKAL